EINQPPVANPDSANTSESTPVTIDVLSNDSDPDGDPIHVVNVTNPQNGSAVINPDDTITYTPNSTFTGTDSFDYTIDDGHGGTASASVTITVADICLFCDDFEDGVLASDWTYLKGSWSESNGSLIADPLGKKSLAIATPAFSGCSTCTIETSMESDGGLFGKVWLLSWYIDKGNRIELLMKEDQDKWILKQRVGGAVVAKAKSISAIDPNVFYDVSLRFDGASIILEVNGTELINLPSVGTPSGTIGFQVKKTVGRFGYINVN
ncbi:MAG TPA: Ig-like domain-containing protein, partial [Acidobacteriota bacterium]